MNAFQAAWKGEEKLWKVFWLYNFIIGSALIYALEYAANFGAGVELSVGVVVLAWAVWVMVSLWRRAFNTGWRRCGYVARSVVVFSIAMLVLVIVRPFIGVDPDTL